MATTADGAAEPRPSTARSPALPVSAVARTAVGLTALDLVVLLAIGMIGLVHLPMPFTGDQALFSAGADLLADGGRLTIDLWDAKQPGIYLWFGGAQAVFGSGTVGVHGAELVQALVLARLTQVVVRDRVEHRWLASLAPLATVAAIYGPARAWDLTQVEVLAALPLLAVVALLADGPPVGRARDVRVLAAGLLGAWVVVLKLLYAPIALAILGVGLVVSIRRGRDAAAFGLGMAGGLLPLALYASVNGLLGELWWSWFVYPSQSQAVDPPPLARLRDALEWELRMHGWLVPLAAVAVVVAAARFRRGAQPVPPRRADPLVPMLAAWFAVGAALVLTQKWWSYHFCLLVVPLGMLATLGTDRMLTLAHAPTSRARRIGALAVVGLCLLWAVAPLQELAHKARVVSDRGFGIGDADRLAIEAEFEPYTRVADEIRSVVPGPPDAAVHVMGNPLIQQRAGRTFAIAVNGWSPEQFTPRLWERTRDQLAAAVAADAIGALWVDDTNAALWRDRSPTTWAWMQRHFAPARRAGDGTWFVPR